MKIYKTNVPGSPTPVKLIFLMLNRLFLFKPGNFEDDKSKGFQKYINNVIFTFKITVKRDADELGQSIK